MDTRFLLEGLAVILGVCWIGSGYLCFTWDQRPIARPNPYEHNSAHFWVHSPKNKIVYLLWILSSVVGFTFVWPAFLIEYLRGRWPPKNTRD